jgi:NAD(P)-dependent dehydrogenase (short-subunit alcohol dehydrogenase family)
MPVRLPCSKWQRELAPHWVTGCGSGIGRACAFELADRGYDVVAGARSAADVERLRESARDRGAAIEVRTLDLAEHDAMPDIVSVHGGLYALINNGGVAQLDVFEQDSMDEFRRVIEVNLLGTVALTKLDARRGFRG